MPSLSSDSTGTGWGEGFAAGNQYLALKEVLCQFCTMRLPFRHFVHFVHFGESVSYVLSIVVGGSNPPPATNLFKQLRKIFQPLIWVHWVQDRNSIQLC
jgi:hypothetical protein